jgi:hypothetical protein
MRKILCALVLSSLMVLCSTSTRAGDDEDTPKKKRFKGKFGGKLEGKRLNKMFEKMDTDGDGKISKEEFKKFFTQARQGKGKGQGKGKRRGQFADRLFAKLDTNGDGYLSKDELKKLPEMRRQARGPGGTFEKFKENFKKGKDKKEKDDF